MRRTWLLLVVATMVPLSGCLGGTPATVELGLFGLQAIQRGDPAPVPVQSCEELHDMLVERAHREAAVNLYQSVEEVYHWAWAVDDVAFAEAASDSAAPAARSGTARDAEVTGTNNQESGADEADILKTDGEWTYVLQNGRLYIMHSKDVGDLRKVSQIDVDIGWGGQMLLETRDPDDASDDRLLLVGNSGGPEVARSGASSMGIAPDRLHWGMTHIVTLELQNRSSPRVIDDRWIEGNFAGARLIDGHAYITVHEHGQHLGLQTWAHPDEDDLKRRGLDWYEYERLSDTQRKAIRLDIALQADEENRDLLNGSRLVDHLPVMLRNVAPGTGLDFTLPEPIDDAACTRVLSTPGSTGRGVSTILALELDGDAIRSNAVQVLGTYPILYGAPGAIVLAMPSQDTWWFWAQPSLDEATDLHWFDLDGLQVQHRASGRVDGIVQDQFGIDVHDGQLRVATTTGSWGRWWLPDPEPMANHLAVFRADGGELVETGRVGGIAPGERIWSARFTDDRAYIVTFQQIDPLWIIDLSDPGAPTILGELEIPGVSTYIHPLDDETLLTIGFGPGPDGLGLDWSDIQVSLFDISDESAPRRADVLSLSPDAGWSWSGAVHEHKAFTYWDALGLLAVPVSTEVGYRTGTGHWQYDHHVGLKLVDVDKEALTLSIYGEVDQDVLAIGERWQAQVERSYFLGFPDSFPVQPVSVYAMSSWGMTAHDLATLDLQSGVPFVHADQRHEVFW